MINLGVKTHDMTLMKSEYSTEKSTVLVLLSWRSVDQIVTTLICSGRINWSMICDHYWNWLRKAIDESMTLLDQVITLKLSELRAEIMGKFHTFLIKLSRTIDSSGSWS